MLRLFFFLLLVLAAASVAAFLAEQPGQVTIAWLGQRMDTSVAALVLIAVGLMLVTWVVAQVILRLAMALGFARQRAEQKRKEHGYETLNRAMAALASGEEREAKRLTGRAAALLPDEPLSHVMAAEAARLAGDEGLRREHLAKLAEREDTAFLGLRGQVEAARRQGRTGEMLTLLDRALTLRPKSRWARLSRLETLKLAGRWAEARDAIDPAVKAGAVGSDEAPRMKAVLGHCMAVEAEAAGQVDDARRLAHASHKDLRGFVPAAILDARLANLAGERAKAHRILKQTFVKRPHPDLVEAEAAIFKAETPQARLERLKALMPRGDVPGEAKLLLGVAEAEAGNEDAAHALLDPLTRAHDDSRAMAAMARAVEAIRGPDDPEARKWQDLERTTPVRSGFWQCDSCANMRANWTPLCPTCQAFDSLRWIGVGEPPVEPRAPALADTDEHVLLEGA
ncbi:HemY protein [Rhodothalassium salexigens DSM 2132]|uniref:HemY protein n=1 Tax=Rhodothalassium salexigens DSM 2132 TaxID=1188247 RepID=A0A4R2PI96_RHOSA|nr:heme biosynthesis HemY N-terminal domain-containing protein [Rhodothalassium salexigens]MBB4211257.1 HemY protein [Rhodothalassium salexigens DSM 2132]MBK1639351.1 hypothetical protein [Rhodothalassium salexigens DSM 2132]TCP35179.1 HemY protein [Rhodothalassium salexigens DSM 2132]